MPRGVLTYIFHSSKSEFLVPWFVLGARWHKFLELVPSCPIYGWCAFFRVVPTIRKYSAREGPAPWILFLTPARRPLQVTVSMLVKLNIAICSHLQRHMHFQQKNMYCNLDARRHMFLQFVPDVWPMQIQHYNHDSTSSKKIHPGSQPLKSCGEPYRLKQSWVIFFLGFDVRICSSELTPHGNYFPFARHLHTKGK